jgi:ATP-dependent DNA helicase RecQ
MDIDEHFKSLKAIYPFKFDLKDEQKRVIQAVMDKKDASVLLPTGYGKSMCYVVPPLLFDQVQLFNM